MEKLLLIFLFFVAWTAAKAQDKIITTRQDTIECRIVSINADRITYEQKASDNQWVGKSIPTAEVSHYLRTGKPDKQNRLVREKVKRELPEHRGLFSLQGGMGHLFTDHSQLKDFLRASGNSATMTNDYLRKLENGVYLNVNLHVLVSSFVGIGVGYNFFHTAAKGEFLAMDYSPTSIPIYTRLGLDEKTTIQFAGPSVLFQQFADRKKKVRISQTLTPGIAVYRNESRDLQLQPYRQDGPGYPSNGPQYYNRINTLVTSNSYAAKGSLAVEYAFTPQLSAGLAGNFMWADLHNVTMKSYQEELNHVELEKPINISHLDYGFIVRYQF